MALFGSLTRADKLFADQFEETTEGDFIYRKSQKGAPIKVKYWERDKFVEAFIKTRQRASWGLMAAMIVLVIAIVAIFDDPSASSATVAIYSSIGVMTVAFLIFWRWAWNAPARALADRMPQGPALGKIEARRAGLRRMSWGQFAWAGLVVVIGGTRIASKVDVFAGWNRLWLIGIGLYVCLLGWRIWQKLQVDRSPD